MSFFRTNSFFRRTWADKTGADPIPRFPMPFPMPALPPRQAGRKKEIPVRILEDWVHRLGNMANEAQDEQLYPLESDILDLRDEISRLT